MKLSRSASRAAALLLALALAAVLPFPAAALFGRKKSDGPYVPDFAKNGMYGSVITFQPEDFLSNTAEHELVSSIVLESLPDPGAGTLFIGDQPLEVGAVLDGSALSGLCFQSQKNPSSTVTSFRLTSVFPSAPGVKETTVTIYLLDQENHPPIAKNMELDTYKNVSITGYFDAMDHEGAPLTFRITSDPVRGSISPAEDGSSRFVYTPYENKTGRDSFTYVAMDDAGNTSPEATVTIRIRKPDTYVTYADLDNNPAHKAAVRLAEENIVVGQYVDGQYFFHPEQSVSRAEFLTMAMAAAGAEPMEGVKLTGFSDDAAIPTWAKGNVSAALKAGVIRGGRDADGAPVFDAEKNITRGEAAVMLNHLLNITDVPAEVFSPEGTPHWAAQAAANLTASGVIRPEEAAPSPLSQQLTMEDAALLLDGTLELLDQRSSGLFG